jgi:DNA repair protein RecO (recombination protein O)
MPRIRDTIGMARKTDVAIVLRRWEFSETSQTVVALSREHGLVRGLAKGALRPNGTFSGGFEPMTRGHLGWIVKSGRELAILTEWMLEDVYWPARHAAAANRAAIYAIDLVSRLLSDEDPHPEVYDALDGVLQELGPTPDPSIPLVRFQWTVLDAVGWRPVVDRDAITHEELPSDADVHGFRPQAGGVVSQAQDGDWRVRRETIVQLSRLASGERIDDAETCSRASSLLAAYARELLGEQTEAMRQAFPELP